MEKSFTDILNLACEYNNSDRLQDSIDLLNTVRDTGKDNAVWNFYLGYALLFSGNKQEARHHLLYARELDPRIPAEGLLYYCVCYDGSPDSEIDDIHLNKWLGQMLPDPDLKISAKIESLRTDGLSFATLYFYVTTKTGDNFFECCAGVGNEPRGAVAEALGNFYLSFYSALKKTYQDQFFTEITDGNSKTWKVFAGEAVSMGPCPVVENTFYWDLLKQVVPDYLGSGKTVYIKVYVAKNGDAVTAECRVNDFISHDLGNVLHGPVSEWTNETFASYKQFFFLVCGEEAPYPYSQGQIDDHVKTAMELFNDRTLNIADIFGKLADVTKDAGLADELTGFIPELCAERAFEKIIFPDKIMISSGGQPVEYTKWQITAYHMIYTALDKGFRENIYPEEAFRECVLTSSTYNVICKAKESDVDLVEQGGSIRHHYNFHNTYIAR